jgi:DNA-binding SARP family transcriptional activator
MDVRVLGSLSILDAGIEASPTAPKLRQLLALLAVNDSQVVPATSLITELWHETPPRSAQTTLQTYVLQLRRIFAKNFGMPTADVVNDLLQTRNGGYRLDIAGAWFDLREYRALEAEGCEQLRDHSDEAAVRSFTSALALWHGSVLLDVDHGDLLEADIAQLERSRLTMFESLLDAELRLGHHREVLSELASLVVQCKFHEDLHALYMLALYRSGYRTRALEVFGKLRASLINELGVEPSPKLRWLQQAILTSESTLTGLRYVLTLDPTQAGPVLTR